MTRYLIDYPSLLEKIQSVQQEHPNWNQKQIGIELGYTRQIIWKAIHGDYGSNRGRGKDRGSRGHCRSFRGHYGPRPCLCCGHIFSSEWIGNRICKPCRGGEAYLGGGIA